MFLDNKYTNCYFSIVHNAQARTTHGYIEKHHIIPKSLGGSNEDSNLVRLTAREHYICHRLLVKMTTSKNKVKMSWALHRITHQASKYHHRHVPTSRAFELLRKQHYTMLSQPRTITEEHRVNIVAANKLNKTGLVASDATRAKMSLARAGKALSAEHKAHIAAGLKGKPKSEEHKQKLSAANKGKTHTEECKWQISATAKANHRTHSDETKHQMQLKRLAYLATQSDVTYTCSHCGLIMKNKSNYLRWHHDNCKQRK